METSIQNLNDQFAIANHLTFKEGPGGLPMAEINNAHASARVALQGGHVVSFQPHGQKPVLWVSQLARYEPGKALRGGIPVCWPWFGPHPSDPSKPAHGFARTMMWSVAKTEIAANGATRIRLSLADDAATRELWPHAFLLQLQLTVGPELQVDLVARNTGQEIWSYTGALHSYFQVGDVEQIAIHGLDGRTYVDSIDAKQRKVQEGPITIGAEVDRIYIDTTDECAIDDPSLGRCIFIAKSGSSSTVVWNPWIEKSRRMSDFGDEEYIGMVCIETANADGDVIALARGHEHRTTAVIRVNTANC